MRNTGTFDELFFFNRPRQATYIDAAGETRTAAADEPRVDHDRIGNTKGLIIEGRPVTSIVDRLTLRSDLSNMGTVLHEWTDDEDRLRRDAIFTTNPTEVVETRLAMQGHHIRIGYLARQLVRLDGLEGRPVRFNGVLWAVAPLILSSTQTLIASDDGAVLAES